jgi:hypothetical protein
MRGPWRSAPPEITIMKASLEYPQALPPFDPRWDSAALFMFNALAGNIEVSRSATLTGAKGLWYISSTPNASEEGPK